MSSSYKYFEIPFENVPANPTYTVWYATWSKERPVVEPGMNPPRVVGVTAEDQLPAGAVLLAGGTKDPPAPPPPPPPGTFTQSDYRQSVLAWTAGDRDQDE